VLELIGIILVLLTAIFVGLYIFAKWATSTTFVGCQSNEELDEDVARRMGYKNYPFMDTYDD